MKKFTDSRCCYTWLHESGVTQTWKMHAVQAPHPVAAEALHFLKSCRRKVGFVFCACALQKGAVRLQKTVSHVTRYTNFIGCSVLLYMYCCRPMPVIINNRGFDHIWKCASLANKPIVIKIGECSHQHWFYPTSNYD